MCSFYYRLVMRRVVKPLGSQVAARKRLIANLIDMNGKIYLKCKFEKALIRKGSANEKL